MLGSVIGTILVIHLKMILGTSLNLITSIGWCLYNYHIGQYPAVTLLGIFSFLYLYGLIKHTRIHLKSKVSNVENVENVENVMEDLQIE